MREAGRKAELGLLGLSTLQGRTQAHTPGQQPPSRDEQEAGQQRGEAARGDKAPGERVIIIKQLMDRVKPVLINAKNDTCRRDGPTRLGDNAARGAPPIK